MSRSIIQGIFMAILSVCSLVTQGQGLKTYSADKKAEALYLINSTIIVNGLTETLNPEDFKSIMVYGDNNTPAPLAGLSHSGIVNITYNKPVISKSLVELASQKGLSGPVTFIINGNTLNDAQAATLRIAPEAIENIVIEKSDTQHKRAVMNINLAHSKEVTQSAARADNKVRIWVR